MDIYQCSGNLFTVTQRKVSVIKHRCLFSFQTQLILLAGVRAESRDGPTAAVADFYTIQLLILHTNAIDETAIGSQNSHSLHTTNFRVLKGVKLCFKNHTTITV